MIGWVDGASAVGVMRSVAGRGSLTSLFDGEIGVLAWASDVGVRGRWCLVGWVRDVQEGCEGAVDGLRMGVRMRHWGWVGAGEGLFGIRGCGAPVGRDCSGRRLVEAFFFFFCFRFIEESEGCCLYPSIEVKLFTPPSAQRVLLLPPSHRHLSRPGPRD